MKPSLIALSMAAALALAATASMPALAEQVTLSATLNGMSEVPTNDSTATGTLTARYDSETNVLDYTVDYSGLTGEATAAHFHGPAGPEATAPPSLPIEGALTSPIAGTATLTDAQEADLLSGMWYFNVHTAAHPDGEIRGQLYQSLMSQDSSASSAASSMMSSEMPSSAISSEMSSVVPSVSSEISSTMSSTSSEMSSTLDPSVSLSVSASVEISGEASVMP